MKLTRFVRVQLAIFAVLTVIGLAVMSATYLQLPAMLGIGRYAVTVQLAATGGLYPTANVSYRGQNIGKVEAVRLTTAGVEADLSIDSDYKVPADSSAWVRSVSAIGEQYVDLVPSEQPADGNLRDGSVIPEQRTHLPQDVGAMLDQADKLLETVADTRLRQVIDEAFLAFNGAGPDLQRFIDSAALLVQQAETDIEPTKKLLDQIGPLLDTQTRSADDIRSWTADLATVTDQLREHDPALRNLLNNSPSAMETVNQQFQDLRPTLPLLASNLVSLGQVGVTYHASLEQLMVVFPPLIAALRTAIRGAAHRHSRPGEVRRDGRLHDRPQRPARLHHRLPARGPMAFAQRTDPDGHAARALLQGAAGLEHRGPRHPQHAVHGIPRRTGTHARTVPDGLRAGRQQPAVRTGHPGRSGIGTGRRIDGRCDPRRSAPL
ncbi:virulence factor Mce family protein [Nocardia asteroides]|nr:MlaD family protein [Nocardia asteroides]SFM63153.1 phospholipid/cholesterol/gamma-HCH transport system substrate-binding protein [Nocardia asteroides]VEG33015.1 virulence factor Mce family protein [Nocardia asteroides]